MQEAIPIFFAKLIYKFNTSLDGGKCLILTGGLISRYVCTKKSKNEIQQSTSHDVCVIGAQISAPNSLIIVDTSLDEVHYENNYFIEYKKDEVFQPSSTIIPSERNE